MIEKGSSLLNPHRGWRPTGQGRLVLGKVLGKIVIRDSLVSETANPEKSGDAKPQA